MLYLCLPRMKSDKRGPEYVLSSSHTDHHERFGRLLVNGSGLPGSTWVVHGSMLGKEDRFSYDLHGQLVDGIFFLSQLGPNGIPGSIGIGL